MSSAATRSVIIRLRLEMGQFNKAFAQMGARVDAMSGKLIAMDKTLSSQRRSWDQVGSSMLKVSAIAAAGVGVAIKAAVDWETAWAGVTKTTSGTAKQMAELERQLRDMAKTMPATHEEIAATAEAAGQLGVARQDIADFTRVMVMLGETTNLTADEAATSIAQLTNVMGTSNRDIDNLAATLVALGNDGASTERDIVQMGQRIARAGKFVGLTEGEVLGLANAIASTGIEVEAGGSSVSRILIDMSKAVQTGSADLQVWARTAGMSVGAFQQAFGDSPALALQAFAQGLAKVNDEGGNAFGILQDLGQEDVRVRDTLLALAGSGDLLTKSLQLQGKAWKENTALSAEYDKRSKTAAAEVQKAWNQIKDAMIDVGSTALPAVKDLAQAVAAITDAFGNLPDPVQASSMRLLAMTAVLSGLTWAGIRTARNFTEIAQSINTLTGNSAKLGRTQLFARGGAVFAGLGLAAVAPEAHEASDALGVLTDAAAGALLGFGVGGPWGAAIGGGIGALGGLVAATRDTSDAQKTLAGDIDAVVATLDKQTGAVTKDTEAWIRNKLVKSGAVRDADKLGVSVPDLTAAAGGNAAARRRVLETARRNIDETAQSMRDAGVSATVAAGVLKPLENAYTRLETTVGGTSDALQGAKREFAESAEVAYAQAGAFGQVANVLGELFGGAQRYVGVLETVPESVQTEVAQNGAESSLSAVNSLAQAYGKTPQQIMTALIANDLASGKLRVVNGRLEDLNGRVVTPVVGADIDRALADAAQANAAIEDVRQRRPAEIVVDAAQAISDAQRTKDLLESLRDRRLTVTTKFKTEGSPPAGYKGIGATKDYAVGGAVYGPGTATSDSIDARLSNGEHIWTAAEVDALGGQGAVYALRAAVRAGRRPRFADGGAASDAWDQSFRSAAAAFTPVQSVPALQSISGTRTQIVSSDLKGLRIGFDKKGLAYVVAGTVETVLADQQRYETKR